MSVYIKGMEMPTEGGTIVVYKISGNYFAARAGKDELLPIVPVPEHGRLIDADVLKEILKPVKSIRDYEPEWTWGELYESTCKAIDTYPCVYCTDGKKCTKFSDAEITSWCVLGPCEYETPSNADRIRAMSDRELAIEETSKGGCPHDCETPDDLDTDCVRCWLDWLKSPVEVDNG